jgi:hypothetical protein
MIIIYLFTIIILYKEIYKIRNQLNILQNNFNKPTILNNNMILIAYREINYGVYYPIYINYNIIETDFNNILSDNDFGKQQIFLLSSIKYLPNIKNFDISLLERNTNIMDENNVIYKNIYNQIIFSNLIPLQKICDKLNIKLVYAGSEFYNGNKIRDKINNALNE